MAPKCFRISRLLHPSSGLSCLTLKKLRELLVNTNTNMKCSISMKSIQTVSLYFRNPFLPWFRLSRCKIQQNCKVQRNVRDKQLIKVAYRGTFLICVWMTTILCCQTELRVGISVYLPLTVRSNLTLQGLKITTLRSVKACIPFMCSTKYLALLLDLLFRRKSLGTVHRWPVAPAGDSSEELCCWHRGEGCKRALALVSHPLLTVELCSQDGFQSKAWQGQNLTHGECSLSYRPPATSGERCNE